MLNIGRNPNIRVRVIHGSPLPLGLDLLRRLTFYFTIRSYIIGDLLQFCLFRMFGTIVVVVYVVVEVIDFLVVTKRDAKSVTIRG